MRALPRFLTISGMISSLLIAGACSSSHHGHTATGSSTGTTSVGSGTVYYVATNGNDATAAAGNPLKPWKTVRAAVSNSVPGSIVDIGAGTFGVSNSLFLRESSILRGKGPAQTTLVFYGQNNPPALPAYFLIPSNNCTISGLLCTNHWAANWYQTSIGFDIRQGHSRFTNVVVKDCVVFSHTDNVYVTDNIQNAPAVPFVTSMRCENCRFYSSWDNQTFGIAGAGIDVYPYYDFYYLNCTFENYEHTSPSDYQFGTGIQALLRSSNEPCNPPVCPLPTGTHLTMDNCTLTLQTTNGTVFYGGVIDVTNKITHIWSNQVTNILYVNEINGYMFGVFFTNGVQKLPVL